MLVDLTYNIAESRLTGKVAGENISAYAGSGGRAGSKTPGAVNSWLANNPFATKVKLPKDKSHPGGPLPMGQYRVVLHPEKLNWLRLIPVDESQMHGRSGMAIHGRGARGSDGCIVPSDFNVVLRLCLLVKKHKEETRSDPLLEVIAVGDLDRFFSA